MSIPKDKNYAKSHCIFSVRSAIAKADNDSSEDFLSLRVKTDEEKVCVYSIISTY